MESEMIRIRPFETADWPAVWRIVEEVVRSGDTFAYAADLSEDAAYETWIEPDPGTTVVAVKDGRIVGTAKMGPNRPGPGSHVSTASFMVARSARGGGVGGRLCDFALSWAREQGYAGMQFNAVAASNTVAVHLYELRGFVIVGTVPEAFEHPVLGRVGLHIMYCDFSGRVSSSAVPRA